MANYVVKLIKGFDGNNYLLKDASALSSVILSTTSGTSSATLSIINRSGSTVSNIKMPFVRTDVATTLNSDVTTTWIRYTRRKLTITGNDLTLDMTAESGGWAGTFLGFRDMSGKDASGNHTAKGLTAFGFYGGGNLGEGTLNYFFLGGSYSNPIAKLIPSDTSWGAVGRFEILKAADIVPQANNTYDLGKSNKKWKNLYVSNINSVDPSSWSVKTHTHTVTVSGDHKHNIPAISGGTHKHTVSITSDLTSHSHSVNDPGHTHSFSKLSFTYDGDEGIVFSNQSLNTDLKTTGITLNASSFGISNISTGESSITIENVSTANVTITLSGTSGLASA